MELEDSEVSLSLGAPAPRKLTRLRKAKPTPAAAPSENKEPNEGGEQELEAEFEEGAVDQPAPSAQQDSQAAGSGGRANTSGGGQEGEGQGYYDEEDELEEYFGTRAAGDASASEEESPQKTRGSSRTGSPSRRGGGSSGSDSDSENDADWRPRGAASDAGDAGGRADSTEDLAAETQRVLRETATRDRLGAGRRIEIKPLSSILDKLKQRQALAIARANKPVLQRVGAFEEIMAEAAAKAAPAAAAPAEQRGGNAAKGGEGGAAGAGAEGSAAAVEEGKAAGEAGEDDDLEILGSDAEGSLEVGAAALRIVELPSTVKRKRFASYPSQEVEFEDEVLIDDGYRSSDEEDEEGQLERWERRGGAGSPAVSSEPSAAEEETEGSAGDAGDEEGDGSEQAAATGSQGAGDAADGSPGGSVGDQEMADAEEAPESLGAAPSPEGAAASPVDAKAARKQRKLQRMLLDVEAELSEEEGGPAGTEDEDEDDLDDRGELADLIDSKTQRFSSKDRQLGEQLHREWAERQDQAELQQVLAGLRNGFRRRRGPGFLDDEDEEGAARRRRARVEDDGAGEGGALPFPFGGADAEPLSDEEGEEAELLKRANQAHLLADSQAQEGDAGPIPLDEGSQEVLGLLARSASEPQPGLAGPALARSRFAPVHLLLGSDPSNSRGPGAGLSFLGRQPTALRTHGSASLGGGRSFVFGRGDDGASVLSDRQRGSAGGGGGEAALDGPTSFANLRQMAGLGSSATAAAGGAKRGRRPGPSLVSKLSAPAHRAGKDAAAGQQQAGGIDAAQAVVEQVLSKPRSLRR